MNIGFCNADLETRLDIVWMVLGNIESDEAWLQSVWFSDESRFYLDGQESMENCTHRDKQILSMCCKGLFT